MNTLRLVIVNEKSVYHRRDGVPTGHFAIVDGENIEDLGDIITARVLDLRAKAVMFSEDGQIVIESYQPNSTVFQQIEDASKRKCRGAMYGIEALLNINGREVAFFMGSIMYRRAASQFSAAGCVRQRLILSTAKISTGFYSWHTFEVWVKASSVASYISDIQPSDDADDDYSCPCCSSEFS